VQREVYQLKGEAEAGLAEAELKVHLNEPVHQGLAHIQQDLL
jgi:hypothetical protein